MPMLAGLGVSRPAILSRRRRVVLPPVAAVADYFATDASTFPFYGVATNPSATYDATSDKTFISWERWTGIERACQIDTYDHATQQWDSSYTAGVSILKNDDHGVPAIAQSPAGHIFVFFGPHSNKMRIRSTVRPRDPSEWKFVADLGNTLTYPKPVFVGNDLHFFARREDGASNKMPLVHYNAPNLTGNVPSWSAESTLVDWGTDTRFYGGTNVLGPDGHIWFVATRSNFGDSFRRDVFLFRFDPANGDIKNLDGSLVTAKASQPINLAVSEASYRIVTTTTNGHSSIPQICFDSAGNLHLLYSDGATNDTVRAYHMTRPAGGGAFSTPQEVFNIRWRYNSYGIRASGTGVEMLAAVSSDGTRGGDIYKASRSAAGVYQPATLVRSQVSDQYPLDVPMPVFNGKEELSWIFGEVSDGGEARDSNISSDQYAGFGRVFAWGSGGYKGKALDASVALNRTAINAGLGVGDRVAVITSRRPRETLTLSDPSGQFEIVGRNLVLKSAANVGTYPISITSAFRGDTKTTSFSMTVNPSVGVQDKALAIYNFEGTGQVVSDASGNGLNGYLGSTPEVDANDIPRTALGIENASANPQGVIIPYRPALDVPNLHFFVAMRLVSNTNGGMVISRRNAARDLAQYIFDITNGRYRWAVYNQNKSSISALNATATLALDQWALVEVEMVGTSVIFRQDGAQIFSTTLSTSIVPNNSTPMSLAVQIGFGESLGNGIRATIGCIHMYPRGLNSTEATQARDAVKAIMAGRGVTLP